MYASTSTKVRYSLLVQRPAINVLVQKTQARVVALKDEIDALQAALGIDEDAQAIVKLHICLLHRYNEAKDATQILIGRLATLRNTTFSAGFHQLVIRSDVTDGEDVCGTLQQYKWLKLLFLLLHSSTDSMLVQEAGLFTPISRPTGSERDLCADEFTIHKAVSARTTNLEEIADLSFSKK
ncbi:hypothetical protein AGABI2DRAFT_113644 [Agaricus bisporus var. bisporus H97]|uniref:hypothetical protein n=1 Tax=Agaricus bisporus var. bisporus (strain H97 / ATCC MYA-4626 / FGSC 10389) TaxID=936046 RepID=UPI00029F6F75|nr:hypothetical protein AGABI2DRAFT_113644 [Agaricus bisporus var. bisporus H97]EKV50901.1 hypothetical protein AGABI2DRAFT_113644 [Agaricus bisporus var. bisporus H97]